MTVRQIRVRLERLFNRRVNREIEPDEIFLDSENLPQFDRDQFEGRIERAIGSWAVASVLILFILVAGGYGAKLYALQVRDGETYAALSENNRLRRSPVFAERGVIYDRNRVELAWNEPGENFPLRRYAALPGVAHAVGYLGYPLTDSSGRYYREGYEGKAGAEAAFGDELSGENGLTIIEADAHGEERAENVLRPPVNGRNVTLSIDARLSGALYENIARTARAVGFTGGAGVILDVATGEVVALASYPEFSPETVTNGSSGEVRALLADPGKPFLNRAVSGLYTPGSVVKPIVALGALEERVIDPEKEILSTGALTLPNPFDPSRPSVFKDWKAHGWVDVRRALAVSSNVYFFEVGGGYENQRGLGIGGIERYARMFGLGSPTGVDVPGEESGTIPNPSWKRDNFDDGTWRIGDTYNTAIGQYGFLVTPIQMARAAAAIANGGTLPRPSIRLGGSGAREVVQISEENLAIVREGMRLSALEGTARALGVPGLAVAGKTGTAQLGFSKQFVNSWVVGFFPYEAPRYSFALLMERGSVQNLVGAPAVMSATLSWILANAPEYAR